MKTFKSNNSVNDTKYFTIDLTDWTREIPITEPSTYEKEKLELLRKIDELYIIILEEKKIKQTQTSIKEYIER